MERMWEVEDASISARRSLSIRRPTACAVRCRVCKVFEMEGSRKSRITRFAVAYPRLQRVKNGAETSTNKSRIHTWSFQQVCENYTALLR